MGEIQSNTPETLPIVSVCVPTFRQASFIQSCLDSILEQETNFPYEIVLGEDESDDGTREICKMYAEKFPNIIRLFLRSRKDVIKIKGKVTGRYNFIESLNACRGKYIAVCEGDDYWTDKNKLQKQFNFLETNPEFGICFHKVKQLNTFDESKNIIIPDITSDTIYHTSDFISANYTATCSMFIRKSALIPLPEWFSRVPFGDLGISLKVMHSTNNKAFVMNEVMGVYRIHSGGIHGALHKNNQTLINAYKMHIDFTHIVSKALFRNSPYLKDVFKKLTETNLQIYRLSTFRKEFFTKSISGITYLYYNSLNKFTGL